MSVNWIKQGAILFQNVNGVLYTCVLIMRIQYLHISKQRKKKIQQKSFLLTKEEAQELDGQLHQIGTEQIGSRFRPNSQADLKTETWIPFEAL